MLSLTSVNSINKVVALVETFYTKEVVCTEFKAVMSKPQVVVVEDDPDNLELMSFVLAEDYTVESYNSGESLFAALDSLTPDLFVLDINMPGISGLEICQRLQKQDKYQGLPIVFVSALAYQHDIDKGLETGAVKYFTKPIDMDVFLPVIASLMSAEK